MRFRVAAIECKCHEMGDKGIGKIYGQEKNITTYNLARMNMLLHGVKDTEFEIFHGDSRLANDWSILNEQNPAKKMTFDAVVANPPFSLRWDPRKRLQKISVSADMESHRNLLPTLPFFCMVSIS